MLVRNRQVTEIDGADAGLVSAPAGASLPVDDLTEPGRIFYVFRDQGGDVLGYGGIEAYGAVAPPRSVVVAKDRRGQGVGSQLVPRLIERMRSLGCQGVYMLTTKAVASCDVRGTTVRIHAAKQEIRAYAVSLCIGTAMASVVCHLIGDKSVANEAYERYGSMIQMAVWSLAGTVSILVSPCLGKRISRIWPVSAALMHRKGNSHG